MNMETILLTTISVLSLLTWLQVVDIHIKLDQLRKDLCKDHQQNNTAESP